MNELAAPPGWALGAVAGCAADAALPELLGLVSNGALAALGRSYPGIGFGVTDDGINILVRWAGGPAATAAAASLALDDVREDRGVVLALIWGFEVPRWPEALELLHVVFKQS
ncbi:MAG TPA: hypothetical protein VFL59_07595 [Candidatus Nanopelagicales bacterium]|nr:hypothetical protein [Candidatus Nanopelagicales bacterium]